MVTSHALAPYTCRECGGLTDAALHYTRNGWWRCAGCGEFWPKAPWVAAALEFGKYTEGITSPPKYDDWRAHEDYHDCADDGEAVRS